MCGIVGYSGVIAPDQKLLKLLMIYNALERGKDSAGIYSPSKGIIKDNISMVDFLNKYNVFSEDHVFIGHARAATVGTIIKENAHPFKVNDTVLVHNGTLRYTYPLMEKVGLKWNQFNVDSELLCHAVNKFDEPDFLEDVNGAIATIWTNVKKPNTLYVYRNYERPLYYGYLDGNMYISSIKESLEVIDCKKIDQFDTGHLYTITDGKFTKRKLKRSYHNVVKKFTNVDRESIEPFDLVNRWVRAGISVRNSVNEPYNILDGKWYLAVDYSNINDYTVIVLDSNDKRQHITKYGIDFTDFEICENDYVMVMHDLFYTNKGDKGKKFASKGAILLVTDILADERAEVTLMKNGTTGTVPYSAIRKLTMLELSDYAKKFKKESKEEKEERLMKEKVNEVLDKMNELLEKLKEKNAHGENINGEIASLEALVDDSYFETIKQEEHAS